MAASLAGEVMGTFTLVETLLEFSYVVRNRTVFTPFEQVFFLSAGISEMAGEVMLLGFACCYLRWKWKHPVNPNFVAWRMDLETKLKEKEMVERGTETREARGKREEQEMAKTKKRDEMEKQLSVGAARAILERFCKDPISILKDIAAKVAVANDPGGLKVADRVLQGVEEQFDLVAMLAWVLFSLGVTASPTPVIGFVLTVMRGAYGFHSAGDEEIMNVLSMVSFLVFGVVAAYSLYLFYNREYLVGFAHDIVIRSDPWSTLLLRITTIGGAIIYAVEKVFELYLLLSRSDRLMKDTLSSALIVFQAVELTAVFRVCYSVLLDHCCGGSKMSSPPDQLQRMENVLADFEKIANQLQDSTKTKNDDTAEDVELELHPLISADDRNEAMMKIRFEDRANRARARGEERSSLLTAQEKYEAFVRQREGV